VVHVFPSEPVATMMRRPDLPGVKLGCGDRVADTAVIGSLSRRVRMPRATPRDPQPASDSIATAADRPTALENRCEIIEFAIRC